MKNLSNKLLYLQLKLIATSKRLKLYNSRCCQQQQTKNFLTIFQEFQLFFPFHLRVAKSQVIWNFQAEKDISMGICRLQSARGKTNIVGEDCFFLTHPLNTLTHTRTQTHRVTHTHTQNQRHIHIQNTHTTVTNFLFVLVYVVLFLFSLSILLFLL